MAKMVFLAAVVMLSILLPAISVNHSAPSGPAVMPPGLPCPNENSVTAPPGVILPIALALTSVNQTLPSDPNAIEKGSARDVGSGNSFVAVGGPICGIESQTPLLANPTMLA